MPLLKARDVQALRDRFARDLAGEVTVTLFTTSPAGLALPGADCPYCETTQRLLEEVAALDPRIRLQVRSIVTDAAEAAAAGVDRVPAILIGGDGQARMRYFGIPAGLEFGVLIEDIVAASRADSGLRPQTRQALRDLPGDVHIQVFVTPTCPYCPRTARLAHAMAQESPRVRADVIEANEFPALAERYGVYGVPKVVINEEWSFEGALPEEAFLHYVLAAAGGHPAEPADVTS
ncbi:MAG: thioredoxin family protein [Armatimonadota bacterium]|nr:thioredoxin family protein [Armatimonadota bacterium]MDR7506780.1 thioredoxin family protein [Armatimonadota bacterium]MDR7508350.1 thioredoxin family protein [Armatimonadota bacterium]MDR7516233.1 thioredoxin family protein [Armatimonadota bacterium]MDR7560214.1 thioredoxin family protein [Armatimonadota bacterium]